MKYAFCYQLSKGSRKGGDVFFEPQCRITINVLPRTFTAWQCYDQRIRKQNTIIVISVLVNIPILKW